MSARVMTTHPLHPEARARLEDEVSLHVASACDGDTLQREGIEADVIIVRAPIPPRLIAHNTRLRALVRHGAGTDMIPVETATRAGVLVANVPGVNARSVAEHVMMTTLALARRGRQIDAKLRAGEWDAARAVAQDNSELGGRTMGIVGYGHVGREVATLASAFGLNVMVYDPKNEHSQLDTVVLHADFLVLCCPLTTSNHRMINREMLKSMKPNAFLINVARGALVDEQALCEALANNTIAGAALDVYTQQPLPANHPFLALPSLILTPHVAGITENSMRAMGIGAAEASLCVLRGELPPHMINPEAADTFFSRFGSHPINNNH